jgi:hypothetical protein
MQRDPVALQRRTEGDTTQQERRAVGLELVVDPFDQRALLEQKTVSLLDPSEDP